MWERLDQRYEVAMLARAELAGSSVELQKVVRQYLDSLGLSVQGMLRNRWCIEFEPSQPIAPPIPRRFARHWLAVVTSGTDRPLGA